MVRLPTSLRTALPILLRISAITLAFLVLQPTAGTAIRLLRVSVAIAGLGLGGFLLLRACARMSRGTRLVLIATLVLFFAWIACGFLQGSRSPDTEMLIYRYTQRLRAYEGAPYVWGGETPWGIDCSGLARVALWETLVAEGLKTQTPRLLALAWRFWWRDVGAVNLRDGKYDFTRVVGHTEQLAGADNSHLRPGDIAIVGQGAHVLIYLGRNEWIQAEPGRRHVLIETATPDAADGWFHLPATYVRWRVLDGPWGIP